MRTKVIRLGGRRLSNVTKPKKSGQTWTEDEEALLGTMTDAALAKKIGRTLGAVTMKRMAMDVAAFEPRVYTWTKAELKLLGTVSDQDLAKRLGVSRQHVLQMRQRHGVGAFSPANTPKRFR